MIKIGIIGIGGWGSKLVRVFSALPQIKQIVVYDINRSASRRIKNFFPKIKIAKNYSAVLNSDVKAMVIATDPLKTHHPLARQALLAAKHLWLEKPMTASAKEAADLIKLAERKNLVLHLDHPLIYDPAISQIKKIIRAGSLGELNLVLMRRLGSELRRKDYDVFWDLSYHDFSVLQFWFGELKPKNLKVKVNQTIGHKLAAEGLISFNLGKTNVQIAASWISPQKIRQIVFIGSGKILAYDGCAGNKITIFDLEKGRIYRPKISPAEPLSVEAKHFLDCVKKGKMSRTDGQSGLATIRLLELVSQTIKK